MSACIEFDMEQFKSKIASKEKKTTLDLSNKNIDFVIGSYLLSHKRLTEKQRQQITNIRNILFNLDNDITVDKFDEDFNWQLYGYLTDEEGKHIKPSSAKQYLRVIVLILKWAGSHGAKLTDSFDIVPNEAYESHKICPTLAEIAQIYYFPIDNLPYRKDKRKTLEKVRDTYVMNAIGYGLRYSDLSRIDASCFNGNELTIVQKKTGRLVKNKGDMVLFKRMFSDLIKKYPSRECPYKGDIGNFNNYLKDFLKHLGGTFNDTEVIEYKTGGRIYREEKPRWKCFASHSARRGFITNNIIEKKKELLDVQKAVGHKSSQITEGYIVDIDG